MSPRKKFKPLEDKPALEISEAQVLETAVDPDEQADHIDQMAKALLEIAGEDASLLDNPPENDSDASATATEYTPPKRGRGRPRKTETESAAVKASDKIELKRPAKTAVVNEIVDTIRGFDETLLSTLPKYVIREHAAQFFENLVNQIAIDTPIPKRGPGRPRKVEAQAAAVPAKSGPGRPKKMEAVATTPITAEVPKRGRGRPRKVETQAAVPSETPEVPKRGRGRPRKIEAQAAAVPVETPEVPKRRRGRPRKIEAQAAVPEVTPEVPKRGPGRPRKSEVAVAAQQVVAEDAPKKTRTGSPEGKQK